MTRQATEMADRLPAMFEPQTLLPEQYFTRLQRGAAWTGEQRLMAAILEDAVVVSTKREMPKTSKGRHVLRETLRWIRSNDRTWTFSFLRICETLDLEPTAIRRGIRMLRGEEGEAPARVGRFAGHAGMASEVEEYPQARHAAVG
jgi:hypothetical protein